MTAAPINFDSIRDSVEESPSVSAFDRVRINKLRSDAPLQIEERHFPLPQPSHRDELLVSFEKYLSSFAALEIVELEIYGLTVIANSPLEIETEVHYDLVGSAKDGTREQRVGTWSFSWLRNEARLWRLNRWTANAEIRSCLTGSGFRDVTENCLAFDAPGMAQLLPGMDEWRECLDGASGIDVYGNHGVAVGDIDGSGFDSFYVCQPSGLPNRLYRNRGNGTFEDITARSGVGILDGTASAVFADFSNRGIQDLIVVRTAGPLLFVNDGSGQFELRADAFRYARDPQGTFTSVAVADYNADGLLDVYFCLYSYYQGLNQYQYPTPYYDAQNGPPNYLFRNRGDGTFEDVTVSSGMDQNNNRFSFAAAWCDYDASGRPSLYVANDFGRKNLYHNNGDGTFSDQADALGVEDYGPGMSVCWLDYDNDGAQDVYVANMWLKDGKRITANDQFLRGAPATVRALYQKHNAGNSLYRNSGKGSFQDRTMEGGAAIGRWAWSCASWDFDHDGYPDIYVANGFVSGSNRFDLQSFFWRQVAQRSFGTASSAAYETAWNAVNELVRSDFSWSGYERNVFFANNRNATFSDVSGVLGLDLIDDSRAFALSDFDHDGRLEFVLKNRTGPQIRIMRNDLAGIGASIAFRLVGSTCNRDAIGATVTLKNDGRSQTKFISAGSGFASQHTKELFFGLGHDPKNISISIRWPNGNVDQFQNLPVNHRIEITESQKPYKATPFTIPVPHPKTLATIPTVLSAPKTIRTDLISPLYGPSLSLPDLSGDIHNPADARKNGALVCFFRLDCDESRKQLVLLEELYARRMDESPSVFGIVVESTDRSQVETFIESAKIGFPILLADENTAGAWNVQYRYLFDTRRNMSFPISFQFDDAGAVVSVYQGVMDSSWHPDRSTPSSLSVPDRFSRAMPFSGPYYGPEIQRNYFTYGLAFFEYGYLDAAVGAFKRTTQASPQNWEAWFNLGTVYLNQKKLADAHQSLSEAVRLNPNDAAAWNNLGMVSGEMGNYDEALKQFKNGAQANPNFLLAVQNMVRIYEFQGRVADAQESFENLITLAPNNPDLRVGLANVLMARQLNQRAYEELKAAETINPNDPDIKNDLGVVLMRLGKTTEALGEFQAAQRLAPDFDRPYINAAMALCAAGECEQGRQVLRDYLSRHPDASDIREALKKLVQQ